MTKFKGDFGLQFVTHIATHYSIPEWVELARLAHDKGFHQLWINDNVGYRPPLVLLTAVAAQIPIPIGTAVLVPYFHQPLDLVDSLAALSELCDGREIGVGLARGSLAITAREVEVVRPLTMVRETAQFLRQVLAGEEVAYRDYPLLRDYYHLNPSGKFHLRFSPASPFCFYGGGIGPKALQVTGQVMDGLISSGTFISMVRAGRQAGMLRIAEESARQSRPGLTLRKMCELNVSISQDRSKALEYPKRQVAQAALQWETFGFTAEEYDALGVKREQVLKLKERLEAGASITEAASVVNEDMVRACYVAGQPEEAVEQIVQLSDIAADLGYHQIALAKLGPDYREAITLLADQIMPALS